MEVSFSYFESSAFKLFFVSFERIFAKSFTKPRGSGYDTACAFPVVKIKENRSKIRTRFTLHLLHDNAIGEFVHIIRVTGKICRELETNRFHDVAYAADKIILSKIS